MTEDRTETQKKLGIGRPKQYSNPEQLEEIAEEYFRWVLDNPMLQEKMFASNGRIVKDDAKIQRPMSIVGFCLFAGISKKTFYNYANDESFLHIITYIKNTIYTYKLDGAAAGIYNSSIVARELGLTDKTENINKNIDISTLSDEQLEQLAQGKTINVE